MAEKASQAQWIDFEARIIYSLDNTPADGRNGGKTLCLHPLREAGHGVISRLSPAFRGYIQIGYSLLAKTKGQKPYK